MKYLLTNIFIIVFDIILNFKSIVKWLSYQFYEKYHFLYKQLTNIFIIVLDIISYLESILEWLNYQFYEKHHSLYK